MLDLEGYPHIREQIIGCLDRPALATFARTSSSSHGAVLPYLYPSTLFDPLHTFAAQSLPRAYRGDGSDIPTELPETPAAARAEQKLNSLLSSPHFERARTVIINRPQEWARDLLQLRLKPLPATRGENTATLIRVEPLVPCTTRGDRGPRDIGRSEGEVMRDGSEVGMAYCYRGLEPDFSVGQVVEAHTPPSGDVSPTDHTHFAHLFDIASLIPSERLILYIPPNRRINLHALVSAACVDPSPPNATARNLTILVESGNEYHLDWTPVPTVGKQAWCHVELVLIPNPAGDFIFDYGIPSRRNFPITRIGPGVLPTVTKTPAHNLVVSPMHVAFRHRMLAKRYTIVGIEGLQAAVGEQFEAFKRGALDAFSGEAKDIRSMSLADWKMGSSILADCEGLGARRAYVMARGSYQH